jgi:hypothetical protein
VSEFDTATGSGAVLLDDGTRVPFPLRRSPRPACGCCGSGSGSGWS